MQVDVNDVKARLETHEAVCAERYLGINAQLGRLEKWFVALITAILVLGATIIVHGGMV